MLSRDGIVKNKRSVIPFICMVMAVPVCMSLVHAEKYWIYDAEDEFTDQELYMMDDCGTCSSYKHFNPVTNPSGVPVLSDAYAQNDKSAEMYFPGCQYSNTENFCMKSMSQPGNQRQFPYGTDIWQAFSVFVPVDYSHDPSWDLIYQFHGHPDDLGNCDDWRSPPFSIALRNTDEWRVWGRYSTTECNPDGNGSVTSMVLHEGQPIVKGDWTHFVIHLRYEHSGGGQSRVWLKDAENSTPVMIVDYEGPLGFNDDEAPYDYVSFGYYYGNSPGPDVTLYFDRILWGDENETLESMMYPMEAMGTSFSHFHAAETSGAGAVVYSLKGERISAPDNTFLGRGDCPAVRDEDGIFPNASMSGIYIIRRAAPHVDKTQHGTE
jgi:hypothetical protein